MQTLLNIFISLIIIILLSLFGLLIDRASGYIKTRIPRHQAIVHDVWQMLEGAAIAYILKFLFFP